MRGLRSELLEPELLRLASEPERFSKLRDAWRQKPAEVNDMRDVLSKQVGDGAGKEAGRMGPGGWVANMDTWRFAC